MITKVKHSKGVTKIRWTDVRKEDVVEHDMTSSEDPRPELLNAIRAFTPFVIEICELPKIYCDATTVIGVSLSLCVINDREQVGIVITASKKLERCHLPMLINTPFLVDEAWPKGLQKAVETLEHEALRFRDGDRAQQILPGTEKKSRGKKQTTIVDVIEKTAEFVNSGALDTKDVKCTAEIVR